MAKETKITQKLIARTKEVYSFGRLISLRRKEKCCAFYESNYILNIYDLRYPVSAAYVLKLKLLTNGGKNNFLN